MLIDRPLWADSRHCQHSVSVEPPRQLTGFGETLREGGPSNLLIGLVASFPIRFYGPKGREFESLQARQVIKYLAAPMAAKPSGCVTCERLDFFQVIASRTQVTV